MTIDKQLPSTRTAELDSICLKAEVIPVITIERLEDAVPLGRALVEGGLTVLEITLRTDCALEAIKRMKEALPGARCHRRALPLRRREPRADAAGRFYHF